MKDLNYILYQTIEFISSSSTKSCLRILDLIQIADLKYFDNKSLMNLENN